MVGSEIAAALMPFVKYGALLIFASLFIFILYKKLTEGVVAEEELEQRDQIDQTKQEINKDLNETTRNALGNFIARFRKRRMQNNKNRGNGPPKKGVPKPKRRGRPS